jgi:two-component system chemotaxis response regulator CheB
MSTTSPARVVVADDSALMRSIVSRSLTRAGVHVVGSARDGDEALELCARERPDAMTLDLTMPGLDGLGVLRALRARTESNIPVVVVSAFSAAHGARAVDALAEGAFDLVQKPGMHESLEGFISRGSSRTSEPRSSWRRPRAASSNRRGWFPGAPRSRLRPPSPTASLRPTSPPAGRRPPRSPAWS